MIFGGWESVLGKRCCMFVLMLTHAWVCVVGGCWYPTRWAFRLTPYSCSTGRGPGDRPLGSAGPSAGRVQIFSDSGGPSGN